LKFANFYRQFIKIYFQIVDSLISLLKSSKNKKIIELFKWFKDVKTAFFKLKDIFTTVLIFIHFNLNLKNWVETDALSHTVMRIYTQLQVFKQWNLITYWSQKLLSTENNYETYNLKFLIIVEAFKQWCYYLEESSHSIEILIDHNNLCEFMNVKMLNKRQAQWTVKLAVFNFVILHRLSKINLINVSLKSSNYIKIISESIDRFLSTLQRKLTAISAIMFKFSVIISCLETVC